MCARVRVSGGEKIKKYRVGPEGLSLAVTSSRYLRGGNTSATDSKRFKASSKRLNDPSKKDGLNIGC